MSGSTWSWAAGTSWRPTTTTGRSRSSWTIAELQPWSAWTRPHRKWVVRTQHLFVLFPSTSVDESLISQLLKTSFSQKISVKTIYDVLSTKPVLNKVSLFKRLLRFSQSIYDSWISKKIPLIPPLVDHIHYTNASVRGITGVLCPRLPKPLHALVTEQPPPNWALTSSLRHALRIFNVEQNIREPLNSNWAA